MTGGPGGEDVLASGAGVNARAKVRLVQGSHIVVRKLYAHDRAYMFQNSDGRIVFVIPYKDDFTLIGPPARPHHAHPPRVEGRWDAPRPSCAALGPGKAGLPNRRCPAVTSTFRRSQR